jgi:signal transduction histidine kinase
MVAHELRTPLTSVKGFAQLLLRGPGMANGRRYVELILGESNRLMRIIDDIVDLSRMERGLLEMRREPIALADVVDRAVELLGPNGVALRVNLPTDLPRLRGDPDKLCQTVVNLAQAASVYHQGAEPMDVTADASGSAVTLCLDVVGTIPEHRLAHVFDRLPSGAEPTPTGLSLYIAKNFVEAHGGRLRLETHPGRGRLLMTLPFAEGAPPPLRRAARADGRPRHVGVGPRRALGPRHAPRQSDPDQSP